jgi:tetratricopeptide (TPR) repeat protein
LAGGVVLVAYGVLEGPLACIVWSAAPFAVGLAYFEWDVVMHYHARPHALTLLREAGLVRPEELDGVKRVLGAVVGNHLTTAVRTLLVGAVGLGLLLGGWLAASAPAGSWPSELSAGVKILAVALALAVAYGSQMPWLAWGKRRRAIQLNRTAIRLADRGDLAGAIERYTEAIRLSPQLERVHHNRARAYARAGRFDDALADLDCETRLQPAAWEARFLRGQIRSKRGEYAAALAELDEVLRLAPELLATVRVREANVRLETGEYDRAIEATTEALNLGANPLVALCTRSVAYLRQENLPRALADCEEAVRLVPDEALPYNNRGAVLNKLGRYGPGLADLRTALRLEPHLAYAYKNLAWVQATGVDPAYRDGPEAVANARRALELAGALDPDWRDVLAAAHAEAGQFALAVQAQEEFLARCPPSALAENQARLELYRAGRPFRDPPAVPVTGIRSEGPDKQAIARNGNP